MRFSRKKLVNHDIGPNYRILDALLSLRLLVFPWISERKVFQKIHKWFQVYLDNGDVDNNIWLVDSGRTALYLLLKTMGLSRGDEVLIQGFSCVVVPNAVLQSGLKPIICDVEADTFNIDLEEIASKITKKTKVLIVQHSFGLPVDMQRARQICDKYNLILIEDAAHSLGSKSLFNNKEKNIGSIGDASIFSFGRDKVVSSTIGGLAVINNSNNKKWLERMEYEFSILSEMKKSRVRQSLFYTFWTTVFVRPFYYFFNAGKFFLLSSQKLGLIESVYTKSEEKGTCVPAQPSKYNKRLGRLLLNQLSSLKNYTAHRHKIANVYIKNLGLEYYKNSNYMRVPLDLKFLMKDFSSDEISIVYNNIKKELRYSKGCLIGTWYDAIFLPKTVDLDFLGYKEGDLPVSESLIKNRVLNLPTNYYTDEVDAEMISMVIKSNIGLLQNKS